MSPACDSSETPMCLKGGSETGRRGNSFKYAAKTSKCVCREGTAIIVNRLGGQWRAMTKERNKERIQENVTATILVAMAIHLCSPASGAIITKEANGRKAFLRVLFHGITQQGKVVSPWWQSGQTTEKSRCPQLVIRASRPFHGGWLCFLLFFCATLRQKTTFLYSIFFYCCCWSLAYLVTDTLHVWLQKQLLWSKCTDFIVTTKKGVSIRLTLVMSLMITQFFLSIRYQIKPKMVLPIPILF